MSQNWGYFKSNVYRLLPKTLDDLKANITRISHIYNIDYAVLETVFLYYTKRCSFLIEKIEVILKRN